VPGNVKSSSAAEYQELAREVIDGINDRGRRPILVGGSGLYIRAALDDLTFPGTDPEVRARLEAQLAAHGSEPLYERLREQDPEAAAAILPSNGRRIVRALEVIEISDRPFSATMPGYSGGRPAIQLGLTLPRPELDRRIDERGRRMWDAGFTGEVAELELRGLRDGMTASRALGYAQVLRSLAGEWTDEFAREETIRATRRFARRQESWFRRDPRVTWIDAAEPGLADRALDLIRQGAGRSAQA
jgi:tRNA dimethylallyltransferase